MAVYRRIEFVRRSWLSKVVGVLAIAVGLGMAAALIVLSLSLAVILLPLVIIALVIGRWRWRKAMAEANRRSDGRADGPVIDIDYEVVDDRGDDGPRPRHR